MMLFGFCKCGKYISWDRMQRAPPIHSWDVVGKDGTVGRCAEPCSPRWFFDEANLVKIKNTLLDGDWRHEPDTGNFKVALDLTLARDQHIIVDYLKLLEKPALANDILKWEKKVET